MSAAPVRNVRVPDDLWEASKATAAARATTVAAAINAALEEFCSEESAGVELARADGTVLTDVGLRLVFSGDGTLDLSIDDGRVRLSADQAAFLERLFSRRRPV